MYRFKLKREKRTCKVPALFTNASETDDRITISSLQNVEDFYKMKLKKFLCTKSRKPRTGILKTYRKNSFIRS